jgi:hypothetical protein
LLDEIGNRSQRFLALSHFNGGVKP